MSTDPRRLLGVSSASATKMKVVHLLDLLLEEEPASTTQGGLPHVFQRRAQTTSPSVGGRRISCKVFQVSITLHLDKKQN
jgi:hypothetical protein